MPSIHDVARACGVSTATVSRALRGLPNVSTETRRLVQTAAAELGYEISPSASGLSTGLHRLVAVVVPSMSQWFYTEVVEGADSVLRREGYDAFLIDLAIGPGERERLFSNSLLRKRADGVIALGIDFSDEERRELRSLDLPVVVVGAPVRGLRSVGIDDAKAARLALGHLLSLGHERIALVGGDSDYGMNDSVARTREREWRRALVDLGVVPRPGWCVSGAFRMPQAKVVAHAMLSSPERPTAVFAASDEMAFGVLLAARELGIRVPEDLSVVGIDDHPWSSAFDLTTVGQQPHVQGQDAARLVLDALAGDRMSRSIRRSPVELVLRGSTAAASDPRKDAPVAEVPLSG